MTNANGGDFEAIAREIVENWQDTHSFQISKNIKHDFIFDIKKALKEAYVAGQTISPDINKKEISNDINEAYERGKAEGMRASVVARIPSEDKQIEEIARYITGMPPTEARLMAMAMRQMRDWLLSQIGVSEVVLPEMKNVGGQVNDQGDAYEVGTRHGFNDCLDAIKAANPSLFKERE